MSSNLSNFKNSDSTTKRKIRVSFVSWCPSTLICLLASEILFCGLHKVFQTAATHWYKIVFYIGEGKCGFKIV